MLGQLNVLDFECRVVLANERHVVFDPVRKSYVQFTPEEWVRQYMVRLLAEDYGYPMTLMRLERGIANDPGIRKGRADIILFNRTNEPLLLVECKAPTIKLSEETLYQVSRYNRALQAKFLLITNGLDFLCWERAEMNNYLGVDFIPKFEKV